MFTRRLLTPRKINARSFHDRPLHARPLYERPLSTRLVWGSGFFLLGILGSLGDMNKRISFFEHVFNLFKNQLSMENPRLMVVEDSAEEIPGNRHGGWW